MSRSGRKSWDRAELPLISKSGRKPKRPKINVLLMVQVGNNHPNWLSYFSEDLKPPTSYHISLTIGDNSPCAFSQTSPCISHGFRKWCTMVYHCDIPAFCVRSHIFVYTPDRMTEHVPLRPNIKVHFPDQFVWIDGIDGVSMLDTMSEYARKRYVRSNMIKCVSELFVRIDITKYVKLQLTMHVNICQKIS